MTGNVIHYFAGDHTAKGFYPLYASNYYGLDQIFIIKGSFTMAKASLMKKLADRWKNKGLDTELIHCSSNSDEIEGIILPTLKVGVHDGTSHQFETDASKQQFNLDRHLEPALLGIHLDTITAFREQMNEAFRSAHSSFAMGLRIHDGLEEIYINNMDFTKADLVATELIERIFKNMNATGKIPYVKHRFFGASTPKGVVDFIPNLTEGLEKRYFIKGRAGTGKSTLLNKIANVAENLGFNVEIYHCGFDPESLDMVVIRELGICIFDSTDPHEYFPEKEWDEIIDLYGNTVKPRTDEKYFRAIKELTDSYKSYMKEGISYLKETKHINHQLDRIYLDTMDFSKVNEYFEMITKQVEK